MAEATGLTSPRKLLERKLAEGRVAAHARVAWTANQSRESLGIGNASRRLYWRTLDIVPALAALALSQVAPPPVLALQSSVCSRV